jgi:hypothetical protein
LRTHRHVEALIARPVRLRVVRVDHVQIDRAQRCPLRFQQLADRPEAGIARMVLDGLLVRRHHGAVFHYADPLRPEQTLGILASSGCAAPPRTCRQRICVR